MLSIAACAHLIKAGGIVAFPTETVYGLGADAHNDAAVAKIFAAKGRPADHPLIVHVQSAQALDQFASEVPEFAHRLIAAFWPGPLTVIVPRRAGVASASAGGQNSIGLRCPAHPMAQALLAACAALGVQGLAAPSANQFGHVSPTTAQHVRDEFEGSVEVVEVLDGGACSVGIESTIIDCTRGAPVLLRPGVLTIVQLEAAMGQKLLSNEELLAQYLRRSEPGLPLISPLNAHPNAHLNAPLNSSLKNALSDTLSKASPREAIPRKAAALEATPLDAIAMVATPPKASGTLASHYAPRAKLRLMDAKALQTALDLLGAQAANIAVYSRAILASRSEKIIRRRMPDDAGAAAQQLFAVLRDFDAQHVKLIWVENPPLDADWDGVRDRLERAAA